MRIQLKISTILIVAMSIGFGSVSAGAVTPLTVDTVASGLVDPLFVTFAPGDSSRLFIVEQPGRIRIVHNDVLLAQSFLDIDSIVGSGGSEQGLLGLAFHPEYQSNGYFYVNYTNNSGNTVVRRYQVSSDPDSALASSGFNIFTVSQPFPNHNAGMLAFSPLDGFLYIGLGDGGSGGDPGNRAQNPLEYLGKMLRVDVDGGSPYGIPTDNPFALDANYLPEIWALGLRNPWRYSFDRTSGDLYIADVGQGTYEEVNFQASTNDSGINYGWRLKEGTHCYDPPSGCDTLTYLTDPIIEYTHGGVPFRCSVTGGYVYRGCAIPDLVGTYFYGDYCSGQIWSFRYDGANLTEHTERTSELGAGAIDISSFGEDYYGEIYICAYNSGIILKIIPDGTPSQCNLMPCCMGIRGDINGDGNDANVLDLTFLINYIFRFSGDPGNCPEESDVNADGNSADILDLNYVVNRIFRNGPQPVSC